MDDAQSDRWLTTAGSQKARLLGTLRKTWTCQRNRPDGFRNSCPMSKKTERVRCAGLSIDKMNSFADPNTFLQSIISTDEILVCFATPEKNKQSKVWSPSGTPGPRKAKQQLSRKKLMVIAFFDLEGMIFSHFVPLGQTVLSEYLVKTVLPMFLKQVRRKRPGKEWILHWDNGPHTAKRTQDWLQSKGIETLDHPPYSPDLAPADYWLFRPIKKALGGTSTVKSLPNDAIKSLTESRGGNPSVWEAGFCGWWQD